MPMRYFGNIGYYARMAAYGHAVICADALFDKREKRVHRCDIAKPHGIARARWSDVRLSGHGVWWHVHRVTLESAYGRTPFFEFYIDRFLPFLSPSVMESYPTIAALDLAIDTEIRIGGDGLDYEKPDMLPPAAISPYYQVRADRQGFIPNLSVLDLIFNLGPESPLYLRDLIQRSE